MINKNKAPASCGCGNKQSITLPKDSSASNNITVGQDGNAYGYTSEAGKFYTLYLDNVRNRSVGLLSHNVHSAGTLHIAPSDGKTDLCTVVGVCADKIKADIDQFNQTIRISSTGKLSKNSVEIYVTANVKTLRIGDCYLALDLDFGRTPTVSTEFDGAFKGTIQISAKDYTIKVAGTGIFVLNGTAENVCVSIEGAARVNAFELAASNADVIVNGAGLCKIFSTTSLNATIGGVGGIIYGGSPKSITKNIDGLGRISATPKAK